MRQFGFALLALVAAGSFAAPASAQRRGSETQITIRGTVPTPQVVTVRPRQEPSFSREALVPAFYNRSFLSDILPAYQVVTQRQLSAAALAGANASPTAPALELEIESIRRDLEMRQQKLDSIAARVRQLGTRRDTTGVKPPTPPTDSTRRPPTAQLSRPSTHGTTGRTN
jgi:hypothetical protein